MGRVAPGNSCYIPCYNNSLMNLYLESCLVCVLNLMLEMRVEFDCLIIMMIINIMIIREFLLLIKANFGIKIKRNNNHFWLMKQIMRII